MHTLNGAFSLTTESIETFSRVIGYCDYSLISEIPFWGQIAVSQVSEIEQPTYPAPDNPDSRHREPGNTGLP